MTAIAHFVFDDYVPGQALASRVGSATLGVTTYTKGDSDFPDADGDPREFVNPSSIDGFALTQTTNLFPSNARSRSYEFIAAIDSDADGAAQIFYTEDAAENTFFYIYVYGAPLSDKTIILQGDGISGSFQFESVIDVEFGEFFHCVACVDLPGSVSFYLNGVSLTVNATGTPFDPDSFFTWATDQKELCGSPAGAKFIELMVHDEILSADTIRQRAFNFRTVKGLQS